MRSKGGGRDNAYCRTHLLLQKTDPRLDMARTAMID
jgi:hypothetical protein